MSVFGDVEQAARMAAQHQSIALGATAETLLEKASQSLQDGDLAAVRRYVSRAVALPFDDFDKQWPGWNKAHMMIFMAVTDELEDSDGEGDDAWLEAALAVAQRDVEQVAPAGAGVAAMRRTLAVITQDFPVPPQHLRRIRAVIGKGPVVQDQPPAPEPELQVEGIIAMLRALQAYDDALDELLG